MTTADRILRVYVPTESPYKNLLLLVSFILKCTLRCGSDQKCKAQVLDGLAHLFNMLYALRSLNDSRSSPVGAPVIQTNSSLVTLRMSHYQWFLTNDCLIGGLLGEDIRGQELRNELHAAEEQVLIRKLLYLSWTWIVMITQIL